MSYDWEKKIEKRSFEAADAALPDGYHLIGLAVEKASTCEGALIIHPDVPTKGILMADLFQDIKHDIDGLYEAAAKSIIEGGGD